MHILFPLGLADMQRVVVPTLQAKMTMLEAFDAWLAATGIDDTVCVVHDPSIARRGILGGQSLDGRIDLIDMEQAADFYSGELKTKALTIDGVSYNPGPASEAAVQRFGGEGAKPMLSLYMKNVTSVPAYLRAVEESVNQAEDTLQLLDTTVFLLMSCGFIDVDYSPGMLNQADQYAHSAAQLRLKQEKDELFTLGVSAKEALETCRLLVSGNPTFCLHTAKDKQYRRMDKDKVLKLTVQYTEKYIDDSLEGYFEDDNDRTAHCLLLAYNVVLNIQNRRLTKAATVDAGRVARNTTYYASEALTVIDNFANRHRQFTHSQ